MALQAVVVCEAHRASASIWPRETRHVFSQLVFAEDDTWNFASTASLTTFCQPDVLLRLLGSEIYSIPDFSLEGSFGSSGPWSIVSIPARAVNRLVFSASSSFTT